jgi:hypothetical protein
VTRRDEQMSMRQARHLVKRMTAGEMREKKAPETAGMITGRPLPEEFERQLADAYEARLLCLVCLRPADSFYLIAGSAQFYMKQLVRLGVPGEHALWLAGRDKGSIRLKGMRRAPCCLSCALLAGMTQMPVSQLQIDLHAAGSRDQPVPVAILGESEEIIRDILGKLRAEDGKRDKARRKQEEYEMRLKGAHKDVADFFEKLEKGQLDKIQALGYMTAIGGNGHIKVYHGEPGRAVPSDGRYITSISATPRNPRRTVDNATGLIAKWERENLNTEPEPVIAAEEDEDMPREYRMWSDQKKASLVTRYDYADDREQRELLEKNRIRRRDITRFREGLEKNGYILSPVPVPLPDDLNRTQACESCAKDKTLTLKNFAQEKIQGRYTWLKKCSDCYTEKPVAAELHIPPVAPVVAAENEERLITCVLCGSKRPNKGRGLCGSCHERHRRAGTLEQFPSLVPKPETEDPMDATEAERMIALMGRKREIRARLAVIDEEKAGKEKELAEQVARLRELLSQATRELDSEKERLAAERNQVEDELLKLVGE